MINKKSINHSPISNKIIVLILICCFDLKGHAQNLEINVNPYLGITSSNFYFSIAGNLEGKDPRRYL